jgi:hypothetical protein
VAGKSRHQIEREFLATGGSQTNSFDDELQPRTPTTA